MQGFQEYFSSHENSLLLTALRSAIHADFNRSLQFQQTVQQWTSLVHFASARNLKNIVRLLVKYDRQSVSAVDAAGRSPLHYASLAGDVELVEMLLECGAGSGMNQPDAEGLTPLMLAGANQCNAVSWILFKHGADAVCGSKNSETESDNLAKICSSKCIADSDSEDTGTKIFGLRDDDEFQRRLESHTRFSNDGTAQNGRSQTDLLEDVLKTGVCGLSVHGTTSAFVANSEKSCLPLALYLNRADTARILVDRGADVNATLMGATPLSMAIVRGLPDVALAILKTGKVNDLEAKDQSGFTCLLAAALQGQVEVVKLLVEMGADVTATDVNKLTALHCAAGIGRVDILEIVLSAEGIEPAELLETRDKNGHSCLLAAVNGGQVESAKLLVARGADIDAADNSGKTPWLAAAARGLVEVLREMIGTGKVDLEARDQMEATALLSAAYNGHTEAVWLLLDSGADISSVAVDGRTALHAAAAQGHADVLAVLLCNGRVLESNIIDAVDKNGHTGVVWAVNEGHIDAVRVLVDAGADVNKRGLADGSLVPLHLAITNRNNEILETLLDVSNIDFEMRNKDGCTPLMGALLTGNTSAARKLISRSANVNAVNTVHRVSTLNIACSTGNVTMVKLLLDNGAVPVGTELTASIPLNRTSNADDLEIVEDLIRHGADVNACKPLGIPPLHLAVGRAYRKIVEAIVNSGRANLKVVDCFGYSCLMYVLCSYDVDIAGLLIKAGADVNALQQRKFSLLWYIHSLLAASLLPNHKIQLDPTPPSDIGNNPKYVPLVMLLLENGANIAIETANQPLLSQAALIGNPVIVSELIRRGANVNVSAADTGTRPIHEASNAVVTRLLLDADAEVNAVGSGGNTALLRAVSYGQPDQVELLIDRGADLSLTYTGQITAVEYAIILGRRDTLEVLMRRGAASAAVAKDSRWSPLVAAVHCGHGGIVEDLIRFGVDVNECRMNATPLHRAAISGNVEITRLLIENGANVNARGRNREVLSPVAMAAFHGNGDVVRLLVDRGATLGSESGQSGDEFAWRIAAKNGHLEIAEYLKNVCKGGGKGDADQTEEQRPISNFNININPCTNLKSAVYFRLDDSHRRPCLHSRNISVDQARQQQLNNMADIEAVDIHGKRPVHIAARTNNLQLMKLFIDHDANVNVVDHESNTGLHMAAGCRGGLKLAQLLIDAGADVNAQNVKGDTALHLAVRYEQCNIVLLLLDSGADIELSNNWRNTPFHNLPWSVCNDGLILTWLLDKMKSNPAAFEHRNLHGITVRNCLQACVASLRSDWRVFSDIFGNTALHYAAGVYVDVTWFSARRELEETIDGLLQFENADINVRNKYGQTPLHVARGACAIRAILQRGNDQSLTIADLHGRNFWHLSALWIPKIHSHGTNVFKLVQSLRLNSSFPGIRAVDNVGRTPLHCAAIAGNNTWIEQAQEVGAISDADFQKVDIFGRTPEHYASIAACEWTTSGETGHQLARNNFRSRDAFGKSPAIYNHFYMMGRMEWNSWCNRHPDMTDEELRTLFTGVAKAVDAEENFLLTRQLKIIGDEKLREYRKLLCRLKWITEEKPEDEVWKTWKQMRYQYSLQHISGSFAESFKEPSSSGGPSCIWDDIKTAVVRLLEGLVAEIARRDERFAGKVVAAGSGHEGTQIGHCDEFDFMIELTKFGECCTVVSSASPSPPGYVLLALKPDSAPGAERFREFLTTDGAVVDTRLVNVRFETLVKEVLLDRNNATSTDVLEIVEDVSKLSQPMHYSLSPHKVSTRIKMRISKFVQLSFVPHDINADIVPAIRIPGWLPPGVNIQPGVEQQCHLVFDQPQEDYPEFGWTQPHARITFARTESDMIRRCPPVVKATYMVCKRMIKHFAEEQYFTSNVLKTAVLNCMTEEGPAVNDNVDFDKQALLYWVQKVWRQLLTFAVQDYVPYFSMPHFHLTVWKFEKCFMFSRNQLRRHGLTHDDFFHRDFFERQVEKLKDAQLRKIVKSYAYVHIMYWSILSRDSDLEFYLPPR